MHKKIFIRGKKKTLLAPQGQIFIQITLKFQFVTQREHIPFPLKR